MVDFVGAGCGAKDLITVRGMNLIKEADVIIYAGSLVNPELLEYKNEECEVYNSATMTLEEITEVIKKAECAGTGPAHPELTAGQPLLAARCFFIS